MLQSDAFLAQLALEIFVAVEAKLGRIGEVGTELDEERPKVLVHTIEVIEIDHGRGVVDPGNGRAALELLADGSGHARLFLGHADENNSLSFPELLQAALEDIVFPLPFLEADQLKVMLHLKLADRGNKTVGHRAGLFGRGETMPPVASKEPGNPILAGELGDVGVEIHPVDAFQFEDDVFTLEFGDAAGYIHGGSGWAFVTPLTEIPPPC